MLNEMADLVALGGYNMELKYDGKNFSLTGTPLGDIINPNLMIVVVLLEILKELKKDDKPRRTRSKSDAPKS